MATLIIKTMKKIYFLLMAAFAVLVVCSACSKDEDNSQDVTPNAIIGTWKEIANEGWEIEEGEKNEWNETYNDPNEYWGMTLNANGTGGYFEYYDGELWNGSFKWKLSGNKITIIAVDEIDYEDTEMYIIENVSSNTLILSWKDEYSYEKYTYKKMN